MTHRKFESVNNSASKELVNKKNVASPIWQFFGFKSDAKGEPEDITQAICKLCTEVVLVRESQTTNLFVHLRTHHPAEAAKLAPKKSCSDGWQNSNTSAIHCRIFFKKHQVQTEQ